MRIFAALAITSLMASTASAMGDDYSINVGTDNRNGICRVYLPGDGMELQISVRASDGNTAVSVEKIPADWVEGNESKDVPITLIFNNGAKFKTDGGSYRAGFNYRVSGYWNNVADGQKILYLLLGAQTITASFDKRNAGPFNVQAHSANIQAYAYNFLKRCLSDAGSPVKL